MSLSTPQQVMDRLEAIDRDLAARMPALEAAALGWFRKKRDREQAWASAYMSADGPAHVRKAEADYATATVGVAEEAEYEALKAVVRVLETRATIGQSLLRSHGRA
ncbi:MAG TPA: hypothetical protein VK631_07005 [Solirubrobacteraceae bacterium]|nr:hypothetical protein [Solirubrobacteraceae bacterium]